LTGVNGGTKADSAEAGEYMRTSLYWAIHTCHTNLYYGRQNGGETNNEQANRTEEAAAPLPLSYPTLSGVHIYGATMRLHEAKG